MSENVCLLQNQRQKISLDEAAVVYLQFNSKNQVRMQQDMTKIKQQTVIKKVKYQFVFYQIHTIGQKNRTFEYNSR